MSINYERRESSRHQGRLQFQPRDRDRIFTEVTDLTEGTDIKFETPEERASRATKLRPEENMDELSKITAQFLHKYSKGDLKKFVIACSKIFTDNPVLKGVTQSFISVIKLLNFLALTMLRKTTKNTQQMTLAFLKEQYKHNITNLVSCSASSSYAPPTTRCVDALGVISKGEATVSSFMAKLVVHWITLEEEQSRVASILAATTLTHTAWHGMGILHILFEVCSFYSVSWKSILSETMISTTVQSWKEIFNFCKKYQSKNNEDKTVAWARVIDDSFFMPLTINRHIALASILVEPMIHTQQDKEGIKRAKWVMDHSTEVEYYSNASAHLHSRLAGTSGNVVAGHSKSSKMAEIINNPPRDKIATQKPSSLEGLTLDDV